MVVIFLQGIWHFNVVWASFVLSFLRFPRELDVGEMRPSKIEIHLNKDEMYEKAERNLTSGRVKFYFCQIYACAYHNVYTNDRNSPNTINSSA